MKMAGKAVKDLLLMFPHTVPQFAGEACVQNPRCIRDDVNVIAMVLQRRCPSAALGVTDFRGKYSLAGTAMVT